MKKILILTTLLGYLGMAHGSEIVTGWAVQRETIESFQDEGAIADFSCINPLNSIFKHSKGVNTRYLGWMLPTNNKVLKYFDMAFPPNLHGEYFSQYHNSLYAPTSDNQLNYTLLFKSNYINSQSENEREININNDIDAIANSLSDLTPFKGLSNSVRKNTSKYTTMEYIPNSYLIK